MAGVKILEGTPLELSIDTADSITVSKFAGRVFAVANTGEIFELVGNGMDATWRATDPEVIEACKKVPG